MSALALPRRGLDGQNDLRPTACHMHAFRKHSDSMSLAGGIARAKIRRRIESRGFVRFFSSPSPQPAEPRPANTKYTPCNTHAAMPTTYLTIGSTGWADQNPSTAAASVVSSAAP